jgi:hypothetical protein
MMCLQQVECLFFHLQNLFLVFLVRFGLTISGSGSRASSFKVFETMNQALRTEGMLLMGMSGIPLKGALTKMLPRALLNTKY